MNYCNKINSIGLIVGILLTSTAIIAGVRAPMPHIASTYRIGIINSNDEIVNDIYNELKSNGYKILEFDNIASPWDSISKHDLSYLIYGGKDSLIYLLTNDKNPRSETFDIKDTYYLDIVYQIWYSSRHEKSNTKIDILAQYPEDPNLTIYNSELDLDDIPNLLEQHKKDPNNFVLVFAISKAYRRIGEKVLEEEYLKKAVKFAPFNCEVIIALGNFYTNNNQYSLAIGEYSKCIDDPMNSSLSNYNIGIIYLREKKFEKAKEFFNKIREGNHLYGESRKQLYVIESYDKPEEESRTNKILTILILFGSIVIGFVFFAFMWFKKKEKGATIDDIDVVKKLLADNEFEDAFLKLDLIAQRRNVSKNMKNDLIIYKSRWKGVCREENLGVLSKTEISIEKTKVIKSLLEFLDDSRKNI